MSRIAKKPISIPENVKIEFDGQKISICGEKGKLNHMIHRTINVQYKNGKLFFSVYENKNDNWSIAGTTRAILNNMIIGVTDGFLKKIQLVGVGYRVSVKDNIISLSLGFSHIINYKLPKNIEAECPNQTEITIKGIDKQSVNQVAANIRSYRNPEPYKGKGVRYENEIIYFKETKKK